METRRSTTWLLNLSAEDELAALRRGEGARLRATPSQAERRAVRHLAERWAAPGDRVLCADGAWAAAPTRAGASCAPRVCVWMPTPAALARLEELGLETPESPSPDALIRANARETFRPMAALPGSRTVDSPEGLIDALRSPSIKRAPGASGRPGWWVRPSLTSAARGAFIADGPPHGPGDAVLARARSYAARHLPSGPLDVAPLVDVIEEYSLHGLLGRDGDLVEGNLLAPGTGGGPWFSAAAAEPPLEEEAAIRTALRRVAAELHGLGYFGPFGIDALAWRDCAGARRLIAPLEVNARLTMSFLEGGLLRRLRA